jgi:hypothetical protein
VHRPGNQKVNAYGRGEPRLISEKKEKCVTKKVVSERGEDFERDDRQVSPTTR